MSEAPARLYLVSPLLGEEASAFAAPLAASCGTGDVAAVCLRLAAADERTLVNRAKALAPLAQERGAAALIAVAGTTTADLATLAARSGADGVHVAFEPARLRELRDRLKGERILGCGALRTKHDAMSAGEAGADYVMFGEEEPAARVDMVIERAAWWAEIFETPCVAVSPDLRAIPALAATGAEFVALGEAVWAHLEGPAAAVSMALAILHGRSTV